MVGEGGGYLTPLAGYRTPEFLFLRKTAKKKQVLTYISEKETVREEARPAYL